MTSRNFLKLSISLVVCQLAGGLGALFTTAQIPLWYATLAKPALNPPSWVFGPVWTILYALMGIALYLVWSNRRVLPPVRRTAILIFVAQLALNTLWSILFFGLNNPLAALFNVVALWVAILATIIAFRRISLPASYLLLPYLLWVSFASYLNLAIVILN